MRVEQKLHPTIYHQSVLRKERSDDAEKSYCKAVDKQTLQKTSSEEQGSLYEKECQEHEVLRGDRHLFRTGAALFFSAASFFAFTMNSFAAFMFVPQNFRRPTAVFSNEAV